jgi:hypothetical protein
MLEAAGTAFPAGLLAGFDAAGARACETRWAEGCSFTRFLYHLYAMSFTQATALYPDIMSRADPWIPNRAGHLFAIQAEKLVGPRKRMLLEKVRGLHDHPDLCEADDFRLLPGADAATLVEIFRARARQAPPGSKPSWRWPR